jgi:hypothetical protein
MTGDRLIVWAFGRSPSRPGDHMVNLKADVPGTAIDAGMIEFH